jgi:hypothetical protein
LAANSAVSMRATSAPRAASAFTTVSSRVSPAVPNTKARRVTVPGGGCTL